MALQEIRQEIKSMKNYEKPKSMLFRTNAQHVDPHSSTVVVEEGQCYDQHCAAYLYVWSQIGIGCSSLAFLFIMENL